MIYDLTHRTLYKYSEPSLFARHLLHLLPRTRSGQHVREACLTILPVPDFRFEEVDYFGNALTTIVLVAPHDMLEISLRAVIEVEAPAARNAASAGGRACGATAAEIAEFSVTTALTRADAAIASLAHDAAAGQDDAFSIGLAMMRAIHEQFTYRPGVTSVATTAALALARREGVCQDYAHVMLAALRVLGLPCRYVSGWLRSAEETRGAEQSHAWVSLWTGPGRGWVDFDPTNNLVVGCAHATLAWGRDFDDVSPVRGVIRGGGQHVPTVEVAMQPRASG